MSQPQRPSRVRNLTWWATFSESVQSRLWPLPVAAVIVAVAVGIVLPRLDLLVDSALPTDVDSVIFSGGAETARSVLSSIAGSLITATSLTFSLTVVALQLASSQASPRVLRLFARDRQVHATLALFLGTFAYSLTVLRSVRAETENVPEFVPRISVTTGFVLTLVSVVMLVFFLAHLAAQLRVETMLKDIHADTDRVIDRVGQSNAAAAGYPDVFTIPAQTKTVTVASNGFITGHDHAALIAAADRHSIIIEERRRIGENVVVGTPLASWWTTGTTDPDHASIEDAIRSAYTTGYERTAAQDIGYGLQQIVDISVRALSPGINDPTTAMNALGHLSALLTRVLTMPVLPAGLTGPGGHLRLVPTPATPASTINEVLSPVRHHGAGDPAVIARFLQVVSDIHTTCTNPAVDEVLLRQLDALDSQLRLNSSDPAAVADLSASLARLKARISPVDDSDDLTSASGSPDCDEW